MPTALIQQLAEQSHWFVIIYRTLKRETWRLKRGDLKGETSRRLVINCSVLQYAKQLAMGAEARPPLEGAALLKHRAVRSGAAGAKDWAGDF